MSVLIKHMAMPKGCIYANDKDQTDYCPMLNHDDVPFCQYIENEPESAIGIDERPVYCPLSDVPDTNVGDIISRQAAIDAARDWYEGLICGSFKGLEKRLRALPSAQPEQECEKCIFKPFKQFQPERKKGKWIKMSDTDGIYWACSECGEDLPRVSRYNPQFDLFPRLESIEKTKFCPNCGADMRGEQDE